MCGTSNKIDIIQDHDTGNSRIIPLELIDIDKERYNAIDRDELFGALAKKYEEVGPDFLKLTPEELEMLQEESAAYTTINTEQELIQQHFRPGGDFMTVTAICGYLRESTGMPINENNISREMKKLGFEKGRKRVDGSPSPLSGFYVKKNITTTIEDVKAKLTNSRKGDVPGTSAEEGGITIEELKARIHKRKGRTS